MRFDASRPSDAYLHLGFGHHECLGKHVALKAIPEAVRQVMLMPGIRLADGVEGSIDFVGGPFPESSRRLLGQRPKLLDGVNGSRPVY